MRLKDKNIVLIGSEGRLGKQWKASLETDGAIVISVDKDAGFGENIVRADITNYIHSSDFLVKNLTSFGRVHGLVVAAAFNPPPNLVTEDEWDAQFGILKATRQILKEFGKYWIEKKIEASVVLIGSDLSLTGPDPNLYTDREMKADHYTVVKHAIVGLTRHYSMLWAQNSIRVNCLCPGAVETSCDKVFANRVKKKIPMNRLAKESEYNKAITFLLSEDSSYMTGSILTIDGGRTTW